MGRTTVLAAAMACFALLSLGLGSGLRAEEPGLEGRVATLEKEVAALKARLDRIETAATAKPERRNDRAACIEDTNRMRQLCALAIVCSETPMKDGVFDPYYFVRKGDIEQKYYWIFRSSRLGNGPTDDEIERGDYTNFPWERYRGDGKIRVVNPIPLLWEKEPGADGKHVVGFNDGTARAVSPEELAEMLDR